MYLIDEVEIKKIGGKIYRNHFYNIALNTKKYKNVAFLATKGGNMGVDTIVKIPGKIEPNKIFDFIKEHFDENAISGVEVKVQSQELLDSFVELSNVILGKELIFESGFIDFRYKEEQRSLFFFYANYYDFDAYAFKKNLDNNTRELNGDNTSLSLGASGYAVEILTQIAKEFGGYIDENDCDDKWFYKVS